MLAQYVNPLVACLIIAVLTAYCTKWTVRVVDASVMQGRREFLQSVEVQAFRTLFLIGTTAIILLAWPLAATVSLIAGLVANSPSFYVIVTGKWRGLVLKNFVPVLNEIAVESMRRAGDDGEYLVTTKALKNAFSRRGLDSQTQLSLIKILHQHFLAIGYLQRQSIVAAAYINTNDALPPLKANYVYCVEHRHFKRSFAW